MNRNCTKIAPTRLTALISTKFFTFSLQFGNAFLNRFQCCYVDSALLNGLGLIDTPGVLAGQKQTQERGYDFTAVMTW